MLSLRLEGCSSIGAISTIMNRFECELSSTGSISQMLSRIGCLLPMTVSIETGIIQYLIFVSDEIFSKNIPIPHCLIKNHTISPDSLIIMGGNPPRVVDAGQKVSRN